MKEIVIQFEHIGNPVAINEAYLHFHPDTDMFLVNWDSKEIKVVNKKNYLNCLPTDTRCALDQNR